MSIHALPKENGITETTFLDHNRIWHACRTCLETPIILQELIQSVHVRLVRLGSCRESTFSIPRATIYVAPVLFASCIATLFAYFILHQHLHLYIPRHSAYYRINTLLLYSSSSLNVRVSGADFGFIVLPMKYCRQSERCLWSKYHQVDRLGGLESLVVYLHPKMNQMLPEGGSYP